ncbi:response regulator transcription factor [Granulicella sp. S156]|jgi:DNA-binding response OmpR family regulator|uniref:response regulator transcription factor n=1 Tax=Granulicella sp. S156 TaxID=1747224 RepID=UPI00131C59A4|nr:response regulator transcription factor [Granulicella sp. S156]
MSLILVIEDDPRIQRALRRQFTAEGYEVHIEGEGPAGLAACKSMKPATVVLDLMLPGLSGREVCKGIKAWSAETPVIVLSAISEVADKVLLLETGADDYVTKPFSPRELLARVQAAMRRTRKTVQEVPLNFGNVAVDFLKMEVHKAGTLVPLTAHEFKLLRFFLDNPGRAIAREELLSGVWGLNFHLTTRTVDNQILKLRQKLESDPANPIHFRTVHGFGYKFVLQA